ncbi:hypothetical protein JCM10213_005019, partial [Rhodosporidiobolus nylandii]
LSWVISGASLGIYAITQNINVPIMVQPHLYGSVCAFICCQILHYDRGWRWYSAYIGAFSAYAVVCAGFEVGMVFACRAGERAGNSGGTMTFGIISDVMLAAGFFPQFYEIWKLKEVVGLSYIFLAMDSAGGIFSILSLAFKDEPIDVIALIGYLVIVAFEALVVVVTLILNPRARKQRAALESTCPSRCDTDCTAAEGALSPPGDAEKQQRAASEEEERRREQGREQVLPQVLPPAEEREIADRVLGSAV